jgi:DNA-binding response OmpR family regulator
VECSIPERPFQLLWLLAEQAMKDGNSLSVRQIEHLLWGDQISKMNRQVSDVVRDLRERLAQELGALGKDLIRNSHKQGYRLDIPPSGIALDP